jgi:hypothetical protein
MIKRNRQVSLPSTSKPTKGELTSVDLLLKNIYRNVKPRFKEVSKFQDVLYDGKTCRNTDFRDRQDPEAFTKTFIIAPILDFLGYELVPETVLIAPRGRRKPDYTIRPKEFEEPVFYVEAEQFNIDIRKGENAGLKQANEWLISRASKTDYAIATDGFQWVIGKFDKPSCKVIEVFNVDLRPCFRLIHNPTAFVDSDEYNKALSDLYDLRSSNIANFLFIKKEDIENRKKDVSKKFYNEYVKFVFGIDENGHTTGEKCLLSSISFPESGKDNSRLFSVVLMNRLIFLKFLEERSTALKNLIMNRYDNYQKYNAGVSFYEASLKPLFYKILNTPKDARKGEDKSPKIPYLNGGLFR